MQNFIFKGGGVAVILALALSAPAIAECGPGNLPETTVIGFDPRTYVVRGADSVSLKVVKNGPATPVVHFETNSTPRWQFNQFNAGDVGSAGNAQAGTDFASKTGTLAWHGNSANIELNIFDNQDGQESWKRFYVNLAMDTSVPDAANIDTHHTAQEQCDTPPAQLSRYGYFATVMIRNN